MTITSNIEASEAMHAKRPKGTQKQRDAAESLAKLREWVKAGDTIHAVFRHHDPRSGSTRWDFYKFGWRDGKLDKAWLTYHIARACNWRFHAATDTLMCPFLNMDPAFEVVYRLSARMFEHADRGGYELKMERI